MALVHLIVFSFIFVVSAAFLNKCLDVNGVKKKCGNAKACRNIFNSYGELFDAGCDDKYVLCDQPLTYCKSGICCCSTEECNQKTFTPYGVKKCHGMSDEMPCLRNRSSLALPKHCFNEFNKTTKMLINAGCDIENEMCRTKNTTECVEDKKKEKYICCCPNNDCNDKEYHPFPKTVHKCHKLDGTEQPCKVKTKACYNMFSNGKLTKAGCAPNGTCEGPNKPYCNQNSINTTTCCCNVDTCNKKTFSPKGVKKCYNKYMGKEDCQRNKTTLALPKHCYSKFMTWRSDEIRINGGCDNTNNLCGIENITECTKGGVTKWTCCCQTNDCNKKTFSPSGIKKCLKKDGKEENCRRSPTTLSFPSHCYNTFDKENSTKIEAAGCDNDDLLCRHIHTPTCYRNIAMNKWICCCPNDDCNNKTFTQHGVEWCYGKYGGTIKCKRNRTSLALPTHCFNEFNIPEKKMLTNAGCDDDGVMCGSENKATCHKDEESNKWICCCPNNDCNGKTFTPSGINTCNKKDGKQVNCTRNPDTLALPNHCYNEFDEKNKTLIEAGCDNDDLLCWQKNTTTCYKTMITKKWICCCPNDNCNTKTFTPYGVKTCLNYFDEEKCERNQTTLALPINCFNEFKLYGNETPTKAGCDNDGSMCGSKNKNNCTKDEETQKWTCCCQNDDCNKIGFSPFGVKKCYQTDGKREECKRNETTLTFPNHCYSWFDEKKSNTWTMGGCDKNDYVCGMRTNKTICARNKEKRWVCCCIDDDCNTNNFPPFVRKGTANMKITMPAVVLMLAFTLIINKKQVIDN